jgi:hypothetical protein
MFVIVILKEPAAYVLAWNVYAHIVPPDSCVTTAWSVAATVVFVTVNETIASALSVALCVVIIPVGLLNTTVVDLLVPCVTVPPAPVQYQIPPVTQKHNRETVAFNVPRTVDKSFSCAIVDS